MRMLSLLVALVTAAALSTGVAAQGGPPQRFYGAVSLNGAPAPNGTPIVGLINGIPCGNTTAQDGRYVLDVSQPVAPQPCFVEGTTVTFTIGGVAAAQTAPFQQGYFTPLDLSAGGGSQPAQRFQESYLDLADPRPCMPAPCDANRTALWNGDASAWAVRGVTDPDARFGEIIVLRVQGGDPSVISNIAKILGNPYLQITRVRYAGTPEYVEITNLGGGSQDMSGWVVRSPDMGPQASFPQGYVMGAGQSCRIYSSGEVRADSCGNAAFPQNNVWPDENGTAVLFYAALNLEGATRRYSAIPATQPAQPDLQGVR